MLKTITRITLVLIAVDIVFISGLMLTAMTEEKPPAVAQFFYWWLKNIFSVPLSLIDTTYPFFLDTQVSIIQVLAFSILNDVLIALVIAGLWELLKKVWKTVFARGN